MTTTASSLNGATHTWPPVAVRETPPDERAQALLDGIGLLDAIVATEERKLEALRSLLRMARRVERGGLRGFDDPLTKSIWKRGLDVLGTYGGIEEDEPERVAERRLGVASGHWIFMAGGDVTGSEWLSMPREWVEEQISTYGRAD